jgi:hypothetical protein
MEMTELQFDEAVEQLEQAGLAGVDGSEPVARVFAATCFVMRQWLGLPDSKEIWKGPTSKELSAFLACLKGRQRKRLKQIADALVERGETLH